MQIKGSYAVIVRGGQDRYGSFATDALGARFARCPQYPENRHSVPAQYLSRWATSRHPKEQRGRRSAAKSVTRHALNADTGDLAISIEAEQKARRIAAREYEFHQVECPVLYRAFLHDFGA